MRNSWSHDELMAAFNLYCRLPFGRLHKGNPQIIELAEGMGRTPSAVAMKLVNFASMDPIQQARSISGLRNASQSDREIWAEFNSDPESFAVTSIKAYDTFTRREAVKPEETEVAKEPTAFEGPTETHRLVRVRLVQSFFRDAVLSSYDNSCGLCGLNIVSLLNASHIIPWSHSITQRADPRNGIALCALHDRAFDRGLITLDESFRILVSKQVKKNVTSNVQQVALVDIENSLLRIPRRFAPDPLAVQYHRSNIFDQV